MVPFDQVTRQDKLKIKWSTEQITNLIICEFNGKKIRHREDGFMSLTDMCQATGKQISDWYRLNGTKDYLKVLQAKHYADSPSAPIEVNNGGDHSSGLTGTWAIVMLLFG